jgi:anti-sigma B factor antagonist
MIADSTDRLGPGQSGWTSANGTAHHMRDLALTTRTERGYVVASVRGALDMNRAPALREQLRRLLRPGASRLVIDLSLVSHVDVGGLAVLVGSGRRARLLGGHLRLAAPTHAVAAALQRAGLDRQLDIFSTVQSAVLGPSAAGPKSRYFVPSQAILTG